MIQLSEVGRTLLATKGRRLTRNRYQQGWVEETGQRAKKWKGHYYTYEFGADGREKRVHRASILGLKAQMRKGEAVQRLQAIIDREANGKVAAPSADVTLGWFFEERCLPIWRQNWKASNADSMEYIIRRYAVAPFASSPLAEINRFDLQKHINEQAKVASKSIVKKFGTWIKTIFEEAVDQDYVAKNPARRLVLPETRAEVRRVLTIDETCALLGAVDGRDRLILRMYLVLGLRARELFALRRNDVAPGRIRIDEALDTNGVFHSPKTSSSKAWLWLPEALEVELREWMAGIRDQSDDAILFTASNGSPMRADNWRKRILQVAAERLGMAGVTIHALRRTCATHMMPFGNIKDVQAHLRHSRPDITAEVYVAEIPESVRTAVSKLAERLTFTSNAVACENDCSEDGANGSL